MKRRPEDILILIAILLLCQGVALIAVPLIRSFSQICDGLWFYFVGLGQ
jgi:hypothetical protein